MNRRDLIRNLSILGGAALLPRPLFAYKPAERNFSRADFGDAFRWGVALAAFQNEGAWNTDGKGESIWDRFSHTEGKIKDGNNADNTCDFYNRYREDIALTKQLGMEHFRMSISWSRIFPNGTGEKNQKGIDFYHRVFDACREIGVEPFVTLYHWDLPQALEDKGGWISRDVVAWFSEYTDFVTREYAGKVKNWCVLNEPFGFIGFGYVLGIHAPGKKKIGNLFPGVLHAGLCQAEGGRIIRANIPNAYIGTSLSCSHIDPVSNHPRHIGAAKRMDAMFNRMFMEPLLGLGYPVADLPVLRKIEDHMLSGDYEKLKFDFDYIGLQYYFRLISKNSPVMPALHARQIKPKEPEAQLSKMNWEIYPEGMYHVLKKFSKYPIKEILVTENGCCFDDVVEEGRVHDHKRVEFFEKYLAQLLRAKREGVNVNGYFVWTLTDNFEWAEGYMPRFGLAYTDYSTQKRIIKDSGFWFQELLRVSGSGVRMKRSGFYQS